MATLAKYDRNGKKSFLIQFHDENGKRCAVRLSSKYDERTAREVLDGIERLLYAKENGRPPEKRVTAWGKSLTPELRTKLQKAGLVEGKNTRTLGELWDGFFAAPSNRKGSTRRCYTTAKNRFFDYFDRLAPIESLTEGDTEAWKEVLKKTYSSATVCGQITKVKTVFRWAVKNRLLESNPFENLKRGSFVNKAREHYVTMDDYRKLLDACPDQTWRTIVALTRIGGLRNPSETLRLRWEHVDFEKKTVIVSSSKTERYEGKGSRKIPLFPELREELTATKQEGPFVISRWRDTESNMRTTFEKIVFRAGLEPWERLFQNLRASRSKELFSKYPSHVAAEWMGQSIRTATDHYLSARPEDFDKATEE